MPCWTEYTISGEDSHVPCVTSCTTASHPEGAANTLWCQTASGSWGNCVGNVGLYFCFIHFIDFLQFVGHVYLTAISCHSFSCHSQWQCRWCHLSLPFHVQGTELQFMYQERLVHTLVCHYWQLWQQQTLGRVWWSVYGGFCLLIKFNLNFV